MKKKRVIVAMSGGVDSSVTAALLLEEGYDVMGVTMQLGPCEQEVTADGSCCSLSAVDDARSVADKLSIPFYVMDFRELFAHRVIDYFIQEYREGRTPNPCIACNRYIKFEAFLKKAQSLEADYIATGHYAQITYDEAKKRYLLYRAHDLSKDQSYALYTLNQEQLAHTLLPLGAHTKKDIRIKAAELDLLVADKPDSQEICFVSDNDYKRFLDQHLDPKGIKAGPFLNTRGERVGTHQGIPYYTVGQRKGLGLAMGYPVYVVAINRQENSVVLGTDQEVFQEGLIATDNNFIAFDQLSEPIEVEAKIRYSAPPAEAILYPQGEGQVRVAFKKAQRAITPGQAAVYYQGDMVVGGGTISRVIF